jgi:hypothetical protein
MANKDSSSPTRVDGRINVPGSDLNPDRKKTLRDYLKKETIGGNDSSTANFYPIRGASAITVSNGPNDDGAPTPLTRMEDNQQPHFSFENEAREIFNSVSSGAFFDNYPNSGRQIEAIAAAAGVSQPELKNSQVVGHNMGTSDMVKTISEQVSSVLLNNRFSPPPGEILSSESHASFNEKNEDYKQIYYGSEKNAEDMAKLGVESVLAGSGYSGRFSITDSESGVQGIWAQVFEDFQIDNVGNNAVGLIGIEQDRLRDGTRRVSEKATLPSREWLDRSETGAENIALDYVDNQGATSDEQGSAENHSYTVMNNMISKFVQEELFTSRQYVNGLTFMAAIFVENILLAAIFDALLLAEFIAPVKQQGDNLKGQYSGNPVPIQLAKGKARGNSVPISDLLGGSNETAADIMELFGIPDLQSLFSGPFLVEFIMNFMGINKPIQTKTNFTVGNFKIGNLISFVPSYLIGSLQTTISALKDPFSSGFFFNLGRQVARKSALAAAPKPESLSIEYINYFSKLRDQANFRFFITMVNLGDNAIGQFAAKLRHSSGESILNDTRIKWDESQINPGSVRATPSLFLIPKSFQNFREDVGLSRFKSGVSIYGDTTSFEDLRDQFYDGKTDDSGSGRIPDNIVREIEEQLNNEYMPFYIKDMRTNEIISFHAFLDSLSDGFSATYSQTQGMGRIEAAQTYESSSRAIGLSFTMMAFSKEDMDMLYWKLNKLVTLLYPQFSKGTKLVGADKEFYMPFSQIQTASPMIRLRVGDVLTNNYSTASASRLLGLGDEDLSARLADNPTGMGLSASPKATPGVINGLVVDGFLKSLSEKVTKFLGPKLLQFQKNQKMASQTDIVKIKSGRSTNFGFGIVVAPATFATAASVKNSIKPFSHSMIMAPKDTYKIIGFEEHEEGFDKSSVWLVAEEIKEQKTATPRLRKTTVDYLASTGNIPTKQCFSVPLSDITEVITNSTIEPKSLEFIKENTIIKSFENNSGEGIAGFIDNLQIDWQLNTIMWGSEVGNRAPTGCKITLGFKPIHDITPGIDADGFNRAPVYKVGNLSNGVHNGGALDEEPKE